MSQYNKGLTPYLSAPTSVAAMMVDVIVALLPALAMGVYLFGLPVLVTALWSMICCGSFQWLYLKLTKQKPGYLDLSPWVTGLLLALCCPPAVSLVGITFASFVAIVLAKGLYGGVGNNFLNPALVGRVVLSFTPWGVQSYSTPLPLLSVNAVDALSGATPMAYLHQGALPPLPTYHLFIGFHSGSLGEVSTLMLLLGGVYLLIRRVIRPTIPLSFLASVACLTYCFPPQGIQGVDWMLAQLCSGGLVLAAFFMATDPVTTPTTNRGQLCFGLGCGLLTLLLRTYGSYPEGVSYAILLMNGLVWLLDRITLPRTFGAPHFARSRRLWNHIAEKSAQVVWIRPKLPRWKDLSWPKHFLVRPPGTVPGERYLDRLHSSTKITLSYGGILLGVVAAITIANNLSSLQIYRNTSDYQQDLLAKAMPGATLISETPYQSPDFQHLYAAYQGQEQVGYCVALSTPGFNGPISLWVGVDLSGAVTGVAVVEEQESLGRGTKALTQEALDRFVGRSGTLSLRGSNRIDSISGATVTLEAVTQGVNAALRVVQGVDQLDYIEESMQ